MSAARPPAGAQNRGARPPVSVRKDQLDVLAVTLLVGCAAFWGFQQVLVKATLPEVPPVFQTGLRFAVATVVLLAWSAWRRVALFTRDGTLLPGLVAGALFAAEFGCIYLALQYTTASRATVFFYTAPIWVALLLPLWVPSERLRLQQWLGLACAFAALAFALRESFSGGSAGTTWRGDLLGVLAALLWGLSTVVIRASGLGRVAAEKMLLYQVGVSGVTLPLLSLALGERWVWQFSPFAWTSLAVQSLVGAFASYLLWMWMLGRYPATRMSSFVFLAPAFALLFGVLWLHEPVTPGLLGALALVAGGIVLVNRRG